MQPSAGVRERFRYQPPLDGLRAVAVLAVLAFHYGFGSGGYLGVDIFLVLSGFLITSLLAVERDRTGRIDFLAFWGRRIRRLLPALVLLLVLVILYAVAAAPTEQWARIRSDGLSTLLYVQNWHMIRAGSGTSPLSPTWSLAIEEQWYLVWPPIFLGLMWLCRGRTRWVLGAVLTLAVASALEMAWFGPGLRAYYGTDSRAQSLLLGAGLALLLQVSRGPSRRVSRAGLELAGIAGIIALLVMAADPPGWMYRGGFFLAALAATCVVAAAVQEGSRVIRPVLSLAPLRWLGLISYGVYLYHFVVLRWLNEARTGLGIVPLAALRFTVTVIIATASFVLIERPIRRGTFLPRSMQRVLAPIAIAVVAVLLVVATAGATAAPRLSPDAALWNLSRVTTPGGARRVLMIGDGNASALALTMHGPYDAAGVRGLAAGSTGCRIEDLGVPRRALAPACRRWSRQIKNARREYRPGTVVMLFGAGELAAGLADSPERAARIRASVHTFQARLPARANVVLLTPPCAPATPGVAPGPTAAGRAWLTAVLGEAAATDPGRVRVADYGSALCAGDLEVAALDGVSLRSPTGQLTAAGARAMWHHIASLLPS